MTQQQQKILGLLQQNARLTNLQIAERLAVTEQAVAEAIRALETEGIIKGYTAILNNEATGSAVRAIIDIEVQPQRDKGFDSVARQIANFPEVVAVYLMSGRYDLRIEVEGNSLQDVANFVAAKLAPQDGVRSTATSFLLKRYKESGIPLWEEEKDERLQIVP